MALGAQRHNVLWLILRESLLLLCVGVVLGVPIVFAAGKWIFDLAVWNESRRSAGDRAGGSLDVVGRHGGVLCARAPRHGRRSYRRFEMRIAFQASHRQGPRRTFLAIAPEQPFRNPGKGRVADHRPAHRPLRTVDSSRFAPDFGGSLQHKLARRMVHPYSRSSIPSDHRCTPTANSASLSRSR